MGYSAPHPPQKKHLKFSLRAFLLPFSFLAWGVASTCEQWRHFCCRLTPSSAELVASEPRLPGGPSAGLGGAQESWRFRPCPLRPPRPRGEGARATDTRPLSVSTACCPGPALRDAWSHQVASESAASHRPERRKGGGAARGRLAWGEQSVRRALGAAVDVAARRSALGLLGAHGPTPPRRGHARGAPGPGIPAPTTATMLVTSTAKSPRHSDAKTSVSPGARPYPAWCDSPQLLALFDLLGLEAAEAATKLTRSPSWASLGHPSCGVVRLAAAARLAPDRERLAQHSPPPAAEIWSQREAVSGAD